MLTYCHTLQHTATPCNTLQRTAARYHTLPHTWTLHRSATHCNTLQRTNALQHTWHTDALQHTATHRRTATHCNTQMHCNARQDTRHLQHTATHKCTATHCNAQTHCNTLGTQTRNNTLDTQTHCNTLKTQTGGCSKHHRGFRAFATGPLRLAVCRNIFSYLCGCNMAVLMRVWHACIHTRVTYMYSCACDIHVFVRVLFAVFMFVIWLILCICGPFRLSMWGTRCSLRHILTCFAWHALFIRAKYLIHICQMPLSYMRNAAFIDAKCRFDRCEMAPWQEVSKA